MIHIYIIIILAVYISVALHPFPHLMPWKHLLTYDYIYYPMFNVAIPNGSRMGVWGCPLKTRPPPIQKGM